jgi:crotonobetainyl-CoA:carnitine CoA-transferase CaiB-like acyl-CoA transferase
MAPAFSDLTVLDLSHALAGPFASTMLADFGADVIKIETPGSGDMARAWGPPFYDDVETGERHPSYFVNLHRNKRSVELDLKNPEGKALFFELVERADVVLENLRVGTVQKLGVHYDAVRDRQPGIIYCSVSGFGQAGPYRDRAALDLIVQAESGMISITGPPGGPGVRCGVSIADIVAGMFAAFGITTALHARHRTGMGQFIDVSMLEGQMSIMQTVIGAYLADGVVPQPMGTAYASLLPYQTFRTQTRDLALGIGSDKLWQLFCPLAGLASLASDPRYATNAARNANRASLIDALQAAFLTKTYDEWEAILGPAGIPVGCINTVDRIVSHPQVVARGSLVESEHPAAGVLKLVGPAVRLSQTPGAIRRPAPRLGEHTDEVLGERLGLKAEALARLRRIGAIGAPRAPRAPRGTPT